MINFPTKWSRWWCEGWRRPLQTKSETSRRGIVIRLRGIIVRLQGIMIRLWGIMIHHRRIIIRFRGIMICLWGIMIPSRDYDPPSMNREIMIRLWGIMIRFRWIMIRLRGIMIHHRGIMIRHGGIMICLRRITIRRRGIMIYRRGIMIRLRQVMGIEILIFLIWPSYYQLSNQSMDRSIYGVLSTHGRTDWCGWTDSLIDRRNDVRMVGPSLLSREEDLYQIRRRLFTPLLSTQIFFYFR